MPLTLPPRPSPPPQRLAAATAAAVVALTAQSPLAFAAQVPGYDGPVLCDAACTAVRRPPFPPCTRPAALLFATRKRMAMRRWSAGSRLPSDRRASLALPAALASHLPVAPCPLFSSFLRQSLEKVAPVTTASGLVYKDIVKGSGPKPNPGFQARELPSPPGGTRPWAHPDPGKKSAPAHPLPRLGPRAAGRRRLRRDDPGPARLRVDPREGQARGHPRHLRGRGRPGVRDQGRAAP